MEDILVLTDENGAKVRFEILDIVEYEGEGCGAVSGGRRRRRAGAYSRGFILRTWTTEKSSMKGLRTTG